MVPGSGGRVEVVRSGQIWIYSEGGANRFAEGLDVECERER